MPGTFNYRLCVFSLWISWLAIDLSLWPCTSVLIGLFITHLKIYQVVLSRKWHTWKMSSITACLEFYVRKIMLKGSCNGDKDISGKTNSRNSDSGKSHFGKLCTGRRTRAVFEMIACWFEWYSVSRLNWLPEHLANDSNWGLPFTFLLRGSSRKMF